MTNELKKQILGCTDFKVEKIEVPEWNQTLWVRVMPGHARDFFEAGLQGKDEIERLQNIRARLAVLTLCDEAGNLIFDESDIDALGEKSSKALDRIFEVSSKLNGLSDDDIEGLKKN